MIKQLLTGVTLCLLTGVQLAYACPMASDITSSSFCSTFQTVAQCHCVAHGLPARMCNDMNTIYQRMLIVYGSLEQACQHQTDTSPQHCVDSWNCFLRGGTTSTNELCSGTGAACA